MSTWHDLMEKRILREEPGVPWYLEDKVACQDFLTAHGLPGVEPLRVFDSPESVSFTGLPSTFVLKPSAQSSTKGVMVLQRDGAEFHDLMRARTVTFEEIVAEQSALWDETPSPDKRILIERKVNDIGRYPVPRDIKFYAFQGVVELVLVIDRNAKPSNVDWFDSSFKRVSPDVVACNPKYVTRKETARPTQWESLLAVAREASLAVPAPFASIDMYTTPSGPLIGEITLTPGGIYHRQHFNLSDAQERRMGALWEEAARRMEAEPSQNPVP